MKVISIDDLRAQPRLYKEIAAILEKGGMVAFPGKTTYRLGVDALLPDSVHRLQQAKRRASNRPALVYLSGPSDLEGLVNEVPEVAQKVMEKLWPGPVTVRLKPDNKLPREVRRALAKATGRIGVRIPVAEVALGVVKAFGKPLLVSSANRSRKSGAQSVAQVKKNFGNMVDLLVDAGDLPQGKPSTIIDTTDSSWKLVRKGSVSADEIRQAVGIAPR